MLPSEGRRSRLKRGILLYLRIGEGHGEVRTKRKVAGVGWRVKDTKETRENEGGGGEGGEEERARTFKVSSWLPFPSCYCYERGDDGTDC